MRLNKQQNEVKEVPSPMTIGLQTIQQLFPLHTLFIDALDHVNSMDV